MDGGGFGEASEARFRQGNYDAAGISFVISSRDEAFFDQACDAASHPGARAEGARRELAHAQFAPGPSELGQHVEIAERQPGGLPQIGSQPAHERRVRLQEREPGVERPTARRRLGDEPLDQRGRINLGIYLHVQRSSPRVIAFATIAYRSDEGETMAKTSAAARLTAPPDEETLAATTVALEEHGFSVEVV